MIHLSIPAEARPVVLDVPRAGVVERKGDAIPPPADDWVYVETDDAKPSRVWIAYLAVAVVLVWWAF